jgi:hypothetical protein
VSEDIKPTIALTLCPPVRVVLGSGKRGRRRAATTAAMELLRAVPGHLYDAARLTVNRFHLYVNNPSTSYLALIEHVIVTLVVLQLVTGWLFPREGALPRCRARTSDARVRVCVYSCGAQV